MKLFYSPGACSLSVHIALREAEQAFDLERVDLRSHRTASGADFLRINPNGYVPALQIAGDADPILTENAAILQFVADLDPATRLAPANGTLARYQLQEMLSFIASEVHKPFGPLFHPDTPAPTAERSRAQIAKRFRHLDDMLEAGGFLRGDTFTVADCYLFAMLRWCDRFELDLSQWRGLDDYFHRVGQRPAVHAALVAEGLVEHKRIRRSA